MATNPYQYIKSVYDAKVGWGNATTDEERKKYETIANEARQKLNDYGYADVANQISAAGADANAAKKVLDTWSKAGKTKTRPYLYDLGKAYNLSESDVDKLISFDESTGEISFGGKNLGRPDTIVDGTSYWSDTSVLDNAFSEYASRTGLTRAKDSMVNQEDEYLFEKYKQEYDDLKNTNPFETETAKAILAKYDLAGLQGRDNQAASGGASNGGNIDSYAAANAMRQQAALVNQGQMVVLEDHQRKLDHARNLLADMGVHIDRVYNQDETSKNNKVSRDVAISESSGYTTDDQLKATSNLWSENGTLADTDMNYQEQINILEGKYDAATTESEKQSIALALKLLEMGRNDKITQTGSKEAKTYKWQNLVENANMKITKEQIAQADRMLNAEMADNAATRQNNLDQIEANAKYGKQTSGGSTGNPKGTDKQVAKANMDSTISKWLYSLDAIDGQGYFKDDWNEKTNEIYAARDKLNDADTLAILRTRMLQAGWTANEWESKLNEWKENIAKKAAAAEGMDETDPYAWIDVMKRWKWVDESTYAALLKKYKG